jgi:hypothetical protein
MTNDAAEHWSWSLPLDGGLGGVSRDDVAISTARDYDFDTVAGIDGWVADDPQSAIRIDLDGWSDGTAGTITTWVCPLEDVGCWYGPNTDLEEDPVPRIPIVSDAYPWRREGILELIANGGAVPGLRAKVAQGHRGYLPDDVPDRSVEYVPEDWLEAERPRARLQFMRSDLQARTWYHLGIGWDLEAQRLELFVDGERAHETTGQAFAHPRDALYVGNPFMAYRNVRGAGRLLSPEAIESTYRADRQRLEPELDPAVERWLEGSQTGDFDVEAPQRGYECTFAPDLTDPQAVDRWVQYGPDSMPLGALEATPEGLLFETRDTWDVENLCTLWSPVSYEGEFLFECDVRIESPEGLALLAFDAKTFDRGDVIEDRTHPVTGSFRNHGGNMRNYWWEFFRRAPPNHPDSHVLAKGPWTAPILGYGHYDLPRTETWHTLRILREGNRIQCAIDDRLLFDAVDDPDGANGPTYDGGRLGLRHMQKTRIRYRNLRIYERTDADTSL